MPRKLRRRVQALSDEDEPENSHQELDAGVPPQPQDSADHVRERRVQEFIRLAKTGSKDILQHYESLIDEFDGIDVAIPPYIKAIVKTLQRAAEPQFVPRDKRRGLDHRLGVIATNWGVTKDDLADFFGNDTYLSRNIIDRLYTLASRVDFESSTRLLLDAQRARRDRNPEDDDLGQWKGISRSILWMPRDIDQAMEASGAFRDPGQATEAREQETAPPLLENDEEVFDDDGNPKNEASFSPGFVQATQSRTTRRPVVDQDATAPSREPSTPGSRTRGSVDGSDVALISSPSAKRTCKRLPGDASSQPAPLRFIDVLSSSPIEEGRRNEPLRSRSWGIDVVEGSALSPAFRMEPSSTQLATSETSEHQAHVSILSESPSPKNKNLHSAVRNEEPGLPGIRKRKVHDQGEPPDLDRQRQDVGNQCNDRIPQTDYADITDDAGDTHQETATTKGSRNIPYGSPDTLQHLAPGVMLDDKAIFCLFTILTDAEPRVFSCIDPLLVTSRSANVSSNPETTLLVPLHHPAIPHWTLAVIHPDRHVIDFYDSLPNDSHKQQAVDLLQGLMPRLFPGGPSWMLASRLTPPQDNSHGCGLIILVVALCVVTSCALPAVVNGACWRLVFSSFLMKSHWHQSVIDDFVSSVIASGSINASTLPVPVFSRISGPACLEKIADQAYHHTQDFKRFLSDLQANGTRQRRKLALTIENLVDARTILGRLLSARSETTVAATTHINLVAELDEMNESRSKCEQEAAHLRSLLVLRSNALPHKTIQGGLSQCARRISKISKSIKELKKQQKRQEGQAESKMALEKASKFCERFLFAVQAGADGVERAMEKLSGL
ncbi:hypothetical protein AK830_g1261 [Neonectria ditissima]|uniref:Ubiquitin-like protease family profile domain-containing protein n=1 Tax=Neonectria ditissima TaxID=78410 RepID=A0A0P7BV30_9HYPO|nr:hypothetical protein AK830_g1261 [Neonectria ditissima]